MNRREFVASFAATGVSPLGSVAAPAQPAGRKRALMKLGCQSPPTSDKQLQFFKRYSVNNICGYPDESPERGYPTVEELIATARARRETRR